MQTENGSTICGDSLEVMRTLESESVDLCVTSPPYDLSTPKEYGNLNGDAYVNWLLPFCQEIHRLLKPTGSLVMNISSGWEKGRPVKKVTQYQVLLELIHGLGFHLAQDMFWHNPAPIPSCYAALSRDRVVSSVECLWWLSKTERPKADNRKVLRPYSGWMRKVIDDGKVRNKKSPSGHTIQHDALKDHGGSIPVQMILIANGSSTDTYHRECKAHDIQAHPAKFPAALPEFFIRFLTDEGDLVLDPFAGSLTTGAVAERLDRQWLCIEQNPEYIDGGRFRFQDNTMPDYKKKYEIPHPGYLWEDKQKALFGET